MFIPYEAKRIFVDKTFYSSQSRLWFTCFQAFSGFLMMNDPLLSLLEKVSGIFCYLREKKHGVFIFFSFPERLIHLTICRRWSFFYPRYNIKAIIFPVLVMLFRLFIWELRGITNKKIVFGQCKKTQTRNFNYEIHNFLCWNPATVNQSERVTRFGFHCWFSFVINSTIAWQLRIALQTES